MDAMCPRCKDEVTSGNICIRCGKKMISKKSKSKVDFVNPNFDELRFDELASDKLDDPVIDYNLIEKITNFVDDD